VKITKEQSKNGIVEHHPDFPGNDTMRGKKCSKCGGMIGAYYGWMILT